MLHAFFWIGGIGALLGCIVFIKAMLRTEHTSERKPGPGEIDAGYYLSAGHIAWNSAPGGRAKMPRAPRKRVAARSAAG